MIHRSLAWAVALVYLAVPSLARATVVEGMTFEQLTSRVPLIVRGTVGSQEARWDEKRLKIATYTEIVISEVLKGDAPPSIIVRQPGGEVGPVGQAVSGAARFEPGEEVLLFLEPVGKEGREFVTCGLAAGKVRIAPDALGRVKASRNLRGIAFYDPEQREPVVREVKPVEDLGDASLFLRRIRLAVKAQKGAGR
ncbi:MAG: hypothetical protein WBV82_29785 [Myxococcaceae bacterium]